MHVLYAGMLSGKDSDMCCQRDGAHKGEKERRSGHRLPLLIPQVGVPVKPLSGKRDKMTRGR